MNQNETNLRLIQIEEANCLSEEETEAKTGTFLTEKDWNVFIDSDADVFKPNGELLLRYRKNVLPRANALAAFPALRKAAVKQGNRGAAAGKTDLYAEPETNVAIQTGTRFFKEKQDGTVSNTHRAKPVESGIIGFFDRITRFPYCRQTAFNEREVARWNQALPYFQDVSAAFEKFFPERAAAQREVAERTAKDFVIENTIFSTITVNRNWQTAVHKDAGDLRQGFGVLSVFRAGLFSGCFFVFPKFRVAVDIQNFSLLLCDVHESHGNSNFICNGRTVPPQTNLPKGTERLSLVFYYREAMEKCGTAAEENERAKRRQPKQKLYD